MFKIKKKHLYVIALVIACIFSLPVINYYVERRQAEIKKQPIRYCYQNYFGPPNAALIIEDKDDIPELVKYYKNLEKKNNGFIHFKLRTLSMFDGVYLIGYINSDSSVAEVVSYNNYGNRFGGVYIRGYVYGKTLHLTPPDTVTSNNR